MNYIVDIGHPAHVHIYRHTARKLKEKGHGVIFTVQDNLETAKELLNHYQLDYISLGKKPDRLVLKALAQIRNTIKAVKLIRQNDVQIGFGSSFNLALASRLTRMKFILLDDDDDEVEKLFVKYAHPYSTELLSPDALIGKRKREDTIYYPGYHELAYLHPKYFQADPSVLKDANLNRNDRYFILRFNIFKAYHDRNERGLNLDQKLRLINVLKKYGRVLVNTERDIEPELYPYQLSIPTHKIHSFLYYSQMFVGDSQTMTSEAAVLGVPAIKCNSFAGRLSVPNELEYKYHLCYSYLPSRFDSMLIKIEELLNDESLKKEWKIKTQKMLRDKIDVTNFLSWFINDYPNSKSLIRKNPHYYNNFKQS